MARRRTGAVTESLETLRELEQRYRGEPRQTRIKALLLLKEDPSRTDTEIGTLLECSERSVRRWWATYTKKGLNALLEITPDNGEGASGNDERLLEQVERMIRHKDFSCVEDVRLWFHERSGVRYSRSEMQYIVRTRLGIDLHWEKGSDTSRNGMPAAGISISRLEGPLPPDFVRFLNALPFTEDAGEWVRGFREALLILFKDVGHIAVNINQTCNLSSPETYRPTMVLRQHNAAARRVRRDVTLRTQQDEGRPAEKILEEFRQQGRPLDNFHPPLVFDYYYKGYAYLGSIFLFQKRDEKPISKQTYDTIDALEPFIIQAMAHHVMCYVRTKSAEQIFQEGLQRMVREAELSPQEQRVVIYHLLGFSYEEMAQFLHISAKTVKKHISTIHQKTGTRRQRELFARYFSPRIDFDPDDEDTP